MLYPKANIPLRDRIKDPYIKEGSSWVDIVVADSWDRDGNPRERFLCRGLVMALEILNLEANFH